MAVSVPNDDYRGSDVHFPSVDGEASGAASHEHGALKIFVGLIVAAGVAFAGIQWQRGRIHSATIAARISAWQIGLDRPPRGPSARGATGRRCWSHRHSGT